MDKTKKINIVVPAAGLSSRFPGMKPKYLLYDYEHTLMLRKALAPYFNYSITIGILKEHDEKYYASDFIRHEFGDNIEIIVLDNMTDGPADTVYQILKKSKTIDLDSQILIKDCDSFFEHEITDGNYVCIANLHDYKTLNNPSSKSFIISNDQGIISSINEKTVVSEKFCVGGYKFESAKLYIEIFETIQITKEVYVSDVIQKCLFKKQIILEKQVNNYVDVGTASEWFKYNDKPVIFCDIDGTIIKAQGRVGKNNYQDVPTPLENNVNLLLKLQKNGSQIIFTTSRTSDVDDHTKKILDNLGFKNYTLISGLPNSKRILINDFNKANPYPRAIAINIQRDTDELDNYL